MLAVILWIVLAAVTIGAMLAIALGRPTPPHRTRVRRSKTPCQPAADCPYCKR